MKLSVKDDEFEITTEKKSGAIKLDASCEA